MKTNYEELSQKLARLQWLLQRHHMQNHTMKGPMADTTRGQGRVLAMLKLQPEISTKDLSYLLGIRQQSLNELLNKLEKGGYVMRTPSEADRRVMMVQITDKGKGEQQEENELPEIFDCLSKDEQETFAEYLDRVISALEEQLGMDADDMADWMDMVRSRMGEDKFERFMSMHGGMRGGHHRGPEGPFGGFEGPGPDRDGRHGAGHGREPGFGRSSRPGGESRPGRSSRPGGESGFGRESRPGRESRSDSERGSGCGRGDELNDDFGKGHGSGHGGHGGHDGHGRHDHGTHN